jgi:hypothetical protein
MSGSTGRDKRSTGGITVNGIIKENQKVRNIKYTDKGKWLCIL